MPPECLCEVLAQNTPQIFLCRMLKLSLFAGWQKQGCLTARQVSIPSLQQPVTNYRWITSGSRSPFTFQKIVWFCKKKKKIIKNV